MIIHKNVEISGKLTNVSNYKSKSTWYINMGNTNNNTNIII